VDEREGKTQNATAMDGGALRDIMIAPRDAVEALLYVRRLIN